MKKKTRAKSNRKRNLGRSLIKGLKEAIAYEQGKIDLRTTSVEIPDEPPVFTKSEVKEVRRQLNVSQFVFARYLGVSDNTVKSWERGANTPSGPSARLIQMAKVEPQMFKKMLQNLAK